MINLNDHVIVWSLLLASDLSDIIYFTVCLNGLMLIHTLNGKNSISYTLHAGNLSQYSTERNTQSNASETIRETSIFLIDEDIVQSIIKGGKEAPCLREFIKKV